MHLKRCVFIMGSVNVWVISLLLLITMFAPVVVGELISSTSMAA